MLIQPDISCANHTRSSGYCPKEVDELSCVLRSAPTSVHLLQRLSRFAEKSPREQWQAAGAKVRHRLFDWGWVPQRGNDRTVYIVGLFGSGRWYINNLILDNVGARAKYFLDELRFHPRPTSMIYSGHATIKYPAPGLPAIGNRVREAVQAGVADLIFVYRHPLDSLLTNWVWWRNLFRDKRFDSAISRDYKNTDAFCDHLTQDFSEFKAFADGNPVFFWAVSGQRFLTLSEFVEETELFIQCATLSLRLEDFTINAGKEFSKIAKLLSMELNSSRWRVEPPRTELYRHLAVREKVLPFREFVDGLDAETKKRIEKIYGALSL